MIHYLIIEWIFCLTLTEITNLPLHMLLGIILDIHGSLHIHQESLKIFKLFAIKQYFYMRLKLFFFILEDLSTPSKLCEKSYEVWIHTFGSKTGKIRVKYGYLHSWSHLDLFWFLHFNNSGKEKLIITLALID